jgi:hypothetical protein
LHNFATSIREGGAAKIPGYSRKIREKIAPRAIEAAIINYISNNYKSLRALI